MRIIAITAALAVLASVGRADAATTAKRHKRIVVHSAAQSDPHIACTEFGCGPVPFGCAKRPAYGPPSPYDVVVCPSMPSGIRMR
jgi:hypothetical protein